jgi:hypothetical protein
MSVPAGSARAGTNSYGSAVVIVTLHRVGAQEAAFPV